jgi:hypothetical protein
MSVEQILLTVVVTVLTTIIVILVSGGMLLFIIARKITAQSIAQRSRRGLPDTAATRSAFISYYHRSRTHLTLAKDSPEHRSIQLPGSGRIIAIPEVGGLHHRYERRAA